jgi:hypothetical protein
MLAIVHSFTATLDRFLAMSVVQLRTAQGSAIVSKKRVRPEDVRCYPATPGGDWKLQTMLWLYGLFASDGKGPIEALYMRGAETRDSFGVADMSEGCEF